MTKWECTQEWLGGKYVGLVMTTSEWLGWSIAHDLKQGRSVEDANKELEFWHNEFKKGEEGENMFISALAETKEMFFKEVKE